MASMMNSYIIHHPFTMSLKKKKKKILLIIKIETLSMLPAQTHADEIPTLLCLSSDFGTASHVWLSMDYGFKDQLLASGRGGEHKAAVSDISVCTHHLRSLLKRPTHGEFDFESMGWWASLTSLLRWCWYRRLPELETVKLYLKGKMMFTRQKPLL